MNKHSEHVVAGHRELRDLPVLTVAELDGDPHSVFGRFRREYPFVAYEGGGYIVLRHADVLRLSEDPRLRATETAIPKAQGVTHGALFDIFQHGVLTANDDLHERRRSPISRALAGQFMTMLRMSVGRSTEEVIDGFYSKGEVEFTSQFADKISGLALASLLAVPKIDTLAFASSVSELAKFFCPSSTPENIPSCTAAAEQLRDYLDNLLEERRRNPQDDFLYAFLKAADEESRLSTTEQIFQLITLILGGTPSIRAAIVAQTSLLLSHREQWKTICEHPSWIPSAVNEAMRFEPGIAGLVRISADDIDFEGLTLPAGELVILSTMSAMRDDTTYLHPDVFDIHRSAPQRQHLVFGGGGHRCIAEQLARVVLEQSLTVLTRRIPHLRLEEQPMLRGHVFVRTPSSFSLTWKP